MRSFSFTKRAVFYLLLLLISALPAIFMNNIYGYLPVLFLMAAGAASILYIFLLKRGLTYTVEGDLNNCKRGENSSYAVEIRSRSPFVLSRGMAEIFTEDQSGRDLRFIHAGFAMGREHIQQFGFTVTFAHIGIYTADIRTFRIYDPLGICWIELVTGNSSFPVSVYPKIVDISDFMFSKDNHVESLIRPVRSLEGQGSDYSGVRMYTTGDPIKQIHWKLSAHMLDYLTKVNEIQINTGVAVVFDFSSASYEGEEILCVRDCILESGLSAAHYAVRCGMDCEFILFDRYGDLKKIMPDGGGNSYSIMSHIPPVEVDDDRKSLQLLGNIGGDAYGQSNVILCTGNLTRHTMQAITGLRQQGKSPEVLLSVPPLREDQDADRKPFPESLRILEMAQIPYRILHDVTDLAGV